MRALTRLPNCAVAVSGTAGLVVTTAGGTVCLMPPARDGATGVVGPTDRVAGAELGPEVGAVTDGTAEEPVCAEDGPACELALEEQLADANATAIATAPNGAAVATRRKPRAGLREPLLAHEATWANKPGMTIPPNHPPMTSAQCADELGGHYARS
jgi:hypothetical protein